MSLGRIEIYQDGIHGALIARFTCQKLTTVDHPVFLKFCKHTCEQLYLAGGSSHELTVTQHETIAELKELVLLECQDDVSITDWEVLVL